MKFKLKSERRLRGWWDEHLSPHLAVKLVTGEQLDLVVDSGFNGEVVLPKTLLAQLGLPVVGSMFSQLADGCVIETEIHIGEIIWFGQLREVRIQATDAHEGLLGTELFQGAIIELDPDANQVVFRRKLS